MHFLERQAEGFVSDIVRESVQCSPYIVILSAVRRQPNAVEGPRVRRQRHRPKEIFSTESQPGMETLREGPNNVRST
jgi:hypothetical protein